MSNTFLTNKQISRRQILHFQAQVVTMIVSNYIYKASIDHCDKVYSAPENALTPSTGLGGWRQSHPHYNQMKGVQEPHIEQQGTTETAIL